MKTITTFLICTLCILTGFAQSEITGNSLNIPEKSPELKALYQQARRLENTGTAAEINANRLAIKNAWQEVDPAVAALYKPLESGINAPAMVEREISVQESQPIHRSPEDWSTDLLLREGFIDGLDMDTTLDGDIYIAAYENYIGDDSALYVYRSTDGGVSFALWKELAIANNYFSKIQVISMDGNGDDYLLVYAGSENGAFQVARWNMATGDYNAEQISGNVTDFSVDRNYATNTSSQRVFAIYTKEGSNPLIYSARTTAGSYGLDWVDETALPGANLGQIAFAYGRDGACYTAYKGLGSGNLYARPNFDFNDPTSWGGAETVVDGAVTETINPTIRAARNEVANDKVLIFATTRVAGSSNHFDATAYKRENGAPFASLTYATTNSDHNLVQIDSYIRRSNDVDIMQTSFVMERIDGTEDNMNMVVTYNGNDFVHGGFPSDNGIDVFEEFPSAIAETVDNEPCVAFAGTSTAVPNGYNLYFDAKTDLVGVEENSLEGFIFYPNPANDNLNLSAKNTIEKVSIYSLLGQEVMQITPQQKSQSINISSFATGVYVMKVEVNGQTGTYKIIKK